MNRDAGSYQLSHTWDQVISRSRAPSSCKQSRRNQLGVAGNVEIWTVDRVEWTDASIRYRSQEDF